MSINRRRLSRADLDNLLEGRSAGHARLDGLADAARGPARSHELAGASAAMSVFDSGPAAHTDVPVLTGRRARRVAGVLAGNVLAAKILLLGLGAAAVGGLGLAAANDLPGASHSKPPATSSTSAAPGSGSRGHGQPSDPGHSTRSVVPSPTQAQTGLCASWLADANDPYRADHARYAGLIAAAGGAGNVTAYCTDVVGVTHPTQPAHPSQAVTPTPGGPAEARPSITPNDASTAHPTPQPTAHPSPRGTPSSANPSLPPH